MDWSQTTTLIFDFGNTLVEFGAEAQAVDQRRMTAELTELFGPVDTEVLAALRMEQITAPFRNGHVENTFPGVLTEMVERLYGQTPTADVVETLMGMRKEIFKEVITAPDGVGELLGDLAANLRLGFISNYPCGATIRDALDRFGWTGWFDSIVISGEVGVVKPHRRIYERSVAELEVTPGECVYIGDNWLGDVQGAKGFGMRAIYTTQYESYEGFQPQPGDVEPDARIEHLEALRGMFLETR